MTYETYKILHILGLLLLVLGIFGYAGIFLNGSQPTSGTRKTMMMTNGFGLLFLLFGGFGMAGKLGLMGHLPGWVYVKLFIWLCLGGLVALIKRKPQRASGWIILTVVLALTATIFAVLKPF